MLWYRSGNGKGVSGEVYNIGSNNEWSNIDLVREIIGIISNMDVNRGVSEDLISFVPDRPGHDFRYAINPGKIIQELGWAPEVKFEDGLVDTVRWYIMQQV